MRTPWKDAPELPLKLFPLLQNVLSVLAVRLSSMPLDNGTQRIHFTIIMDTMQFYQFGVAA